MTMRSFERQHLLGICHELTPAILSSDKAIEVRLPPGTLLINNVLAVASAFEGGAFASLYLDGNQLLGLSLDQPNQVTQDLYPRYLPDSGTLRVEVHNISGTAGRAVVSAMYVVAGRANEVYG